MKKCPLVLCVTNAVASNFTANALLAVGAKPAMMSEPAEAEELASVADAVLVNVGTVTSAQAETMRAAIRGARKGAVPWVLDPVAVHLLAFRRALVAEFLALGPSLVRGNRDEIAFLRKAFPASRSLPMLATGATDLLYPGTDPEKMGTDPDAGVEKMGTDPDAGVEKMGTDPDAGVEICGGTPLLQHVTATGCAQGAICAALLGQGLSPVAAARRASEGLKRAGACAAARTTGPGSFQFALLDALAEVFGCGYRM